MFSTFDSLVFVFARFHGISKCPKTLQCLPLSLPLLYVVFSGSNGGTCHLTWLAFVDDETQLFSSREKYLTMVLSSKNWGGRARPSDLIRLECPLTRIFARGSNETLNSASVNGLLTQLNGSLAHKCAPGTDVKDLHSFFIMISQHSAHGLWSPASCLSDP